MSILRDSTVTFVSRIGIFLLQGVAALLLARLLGPEGRGVYALIVTVPHIAAMVCNFGLSVSTAYFISSGKMGKEKILTIAYGFPFLTGIVAFFLLLLLAPHYVVIYPQVPLVLFRTALLLIPVIAFFNNGLTFLQGERRFLSFNFVNLLNPLLFLVSFILFVTICHKGINGAVYSWQVGFVVSAIFAILLIRKTTRFSFYLTLKDFFTVTRYSSRIAASELFTFLNYRLDIFLVGFFFNATTVGYYTVAVVIAETLCFLSSSIASVLLPNFSGATKIQAQKLLKKAFAPVLWITVVMLASLFMLDRFVLVIAFGSDFLPSLEPLRFLYPGVLLLSLYKILSSYIASRGKAGVIMKIAFVGLAVNFGLNLLLIPAYGIVGAAAASSVAYGTIFLGGMIWLATRDTVPIRSLFYLSSGDLKELHRAIMFHLTRFRS